MSGLRDYYEAQGLAIHEAGSTINCSEEPITNAVVSMTSQRASDFQNVIDVGCGANLIYDQALARMGKRVVGIDFTWNFLKLAPAESEVALVQGDATHLPFPDKAFDAVICSETIEHIPDDAAVVRELARVLRPRGWLFFTAPNLWNAARILEMVKHVSPRVHLMEGHLREYSFQQVSRLLAGKFEIHTLYPVGFGWSGNGLGGRIERWIKRGRLTRFSKSIALVARKL
jgi:ubiquinone/menaquinone biosynthesis C-methylase UbiE